MDHKEKYYILPFGVASFLNDIGSNISEIVFPFFATEVLGLNTFLFGVISGLQDFFYYSAQTLSGYLADITKKKKEFVVFGYFLAGISKVFISISNSFAQLAVFAGLERVGKIRDAPRDAIVATISKKKRRAQNFGFVEMMDNFGAVVGILLTIFLLTIFDYRTLILIAGVPSVVASIVLLIFAKSPKENPRSRLKRYSVILNKEIKKIILASFLFNLGFFSYSLLLIYSKGTSNILLVPTFLLVMSISASLSSIPFGMISDKYGRKTSLFIAYSLWVVICAGFIFLEMSYTNILLLFFLYGLVLGGKKPTEPTLVSELSNPNAKASTIGLFKGVTGLALFIASIIAGYLWSNFGVLQMFSFSIAFSVIGIFALVFVKETL